MTMTQEELTNILEDHKKWLTEQGGSRADLSGANLSRANLYSANLYSADNAEYAMAITMVPNDGNIIGWKKCVNPNGGNTIVRLMIPEQSKRSSGAGRKCRAEYATVLELIGGERAVSHYDNGKTEYIVGQTVECDKWCEDRWQQCAGGIHFFVSRIEAEQYDL
jgi:Family of unknown function (DUF5758)/Pentapeptide repeats (8 copies)